MRKIILDTDIGNDVDDIFALLMLSKMKDVSLLGVTTVYGNTGEEAQMVRYVLDKVGRVDVPVFPGESVPISKKSILRGPHITGGFPNDLSNVRVDAHTGAVDFLIEQSKNYTGELEIIAIGPLTNIARAIESDICFAQRIKQLTIMGGMVYPDNCPEWLEIIRAHDGEYNISCDLDASKIVFNTKIPITLIPLDVTTKVEFTERHLSYFAAMPFGLGEILGKELKIWWNLMSRLEGDSDFKNNPHDPIAVVSLYDRRYFIFKTGNMDIGSSHGINGMTIFTENASGTVTVAVGIDPVIVNEIVRKVIK